jgi:hypothetical protein
MLKIISLLSLFTYTLSQPAKPLVGGSQDDDGCLIGAGYDWCEASQSCIRQWITPCEDNYDGCDDCHKKQRKGINIACPVECDNDLGQIINPFTGSPLVDTPIQPPIQPPLPQPRTRPVCPEVMCEMYCMSGFQQDQNGCNICTCNDPMTPPEINGLLNHPIDPVPGECPIPDSDCNNNYVCPRVTEVTHCSRDGISGYTTYRLSLIVINPAAQNIYAIYGDDQPIEQPMSIPPAYQGSSIFNSNLGGIAPELIAINNDAAYDSWLTIGLTDGDLRNKLSVVGLDFNSWTETVGIYTTNGAVFVLDPQKNIIPGLEYVVAQLTIPNDVVTNVVLNAQGSLRCNTCKHTQTWQEKQITFHLERPQVTDPNIIPHNCISWYDGCNTCSVNNGVLGGCTRMMCFREDNPYCLSFAAGH